MELIGYILLGENSVSSQIQPVQDRKETTGHVLTHLLEYSGAVPLTLSFSKVQVRHPVQHLDPLGVT